MTTLQSVMRLDASSALSLAHGGHSVILARIAFVIEGRETKGQEFIEKWMTWEGKWQAPELPNVPDQYIASPSLVCVPSPSKGLGWRSAGVMDKFSFDTLNTGFYENMFLYYYYYFLKLLLLLLFYHLHGLQPSIFLYFYIQHPVPMALVQRTFWAAPGAALPGYKEPKMPTVCILLPGHSLTNACWVQELKAQLSCPGLGHQWDWFLI